MALGYPHPDILLAQLTSRQVAEWVAFATLEPVGNAVPEDPEEVAARERKAKRAMFEGGMKALKEKRDGTR